MEFKFNRKDKSVIFYLMTGLGDFRAARQEKEYLLGSELVRVNRTIFLNPEQEEFSFDTHGYSNDELMKILNKGYLAHKDFLEQQIKSHEEELGSMSAKYFEMLKVFKENGQKE